MASALVGFSLSAGEPLRILIFSGQNNHDWTTTTPKIKSILETSGRFTLDVTEQPETCDSATFAKYDALLSDWNTFGKPKVTEWPAAMKEAFLSYVRDGRGLVIVHSGSSSFPDWEEYQKLVGSRWGDNTGHGPVHQFTVKIADPDHPITRGMGSFKTTDELWHRTFVQPGIHVLATAFSAKEQAGSGNDEPVAFVKNYGKGRCFNLILGHDTRAMESAGFQALLRRGAEWAASGVVTLSATSAPGKAELEAALKDAAGYRFGQSRKPILALEELVAQVSGDPNARPLLASLLAALLNSQATVEAKQVFCAQLGLIGSAAEVSALARLLSDAELSYYARLALERIPGDEATVALQEALATTSGQIRMGIIDSLAVRRSERSIPLLAKLIQGTDVETASAAVWALGRIGNGRAAEALVEAESRVPAPARVRWAEAQLCCAESLLKTGSREQAAQMLERLLAPGQLPRIRMAAFPSYAFALGNQGAVKVLSALEGQDEVLRAAAIETLRKAPGPALLPAAARHLATLPADSQVRLITLLAERKVSQALPEITSLVSSKDLAVKRAALLAIGSVGNASSIPALVSVLASREAAEKQLGAEALVRLAGEGVNQSLIEALKTAPVEVRPQLIRVLVDRGGPEAISILTVGAQESNDSTRQEAITGLGKLAGADSCAFLIELLGSSAADTGVIESALSEICRRTDSMGAVLGALANADPAKKVALMNVLASVGGPSACQALRAEMKSGQGEVELAAVRLLGNWADAAPLKDLAALAGSTTDSRLKALALRGVSRLVSQAKGESADEMVGLVLPLLSSAAPEEQKALLGALGSLPSISAAKAAATLLKSSELAGEAGLAVLKILDEIGREQRAEAKPILEQVKAACGNPEMAERVAALELKFGEWENLSVEARAVNTDGLSVDGEGGPAQSAIDGKPATYWDEADNHPLYGIQIQLKQPSKVVFLRIMGWAQENFAPKDFEVLCDGKPVKKVEGARYKNNWLTVDLPPHRCANLELKITGYYGSSPAIRELEIYGRAE